MDTHTYDHTNTFKHTQKSHTESHTASQMTPHPFLDMMPAHSVPGKAHLWLHSWLCASCRMWWQLVPPRPAGLHQCALLPLQLLSLTHTLALTCFTQGEALIGGRLRRRHSLRQQKRVVSPCSGSPYAMYHECQIYATAFEQVSVAVKVRVRCICLCLCSAIRHRHVHCCLTPTIKHKQPAFECGALVAYACRLP